MIKDYIKKHFNLILTIFVFTIFIAYTAYHAFLAGRMGWEDESHFWIIIKNCSIPQIFDLMKVEGHMMLWYLAVKPFTFFPYPYPMQIINWLFCLGAMIILWRKAPFDNFIKTLIVLSPVFFQLYSIHARCYSIGVFFLFWACALYKDRLNKPYLFFFILLLAANTHIQALFAAVALGLVFLYDLIKEKRYKELAIISTITFLVGVMYFFQFYGVKKPDYEGVVTDIVNSYNMVGMFFGTVPVGFDYVLLSKIIAARCFVFIMTLVFATRARVFFIYIFIFMISGLFFNIVYLPRYWHIAFFFVYFIFAYWIFIEENPDYEISKKFRYLVLILLLSLIPTEVIVPHDKDFLYYTVMKNKELQEGKMFTSIWPITVSISLPQLNEKGIYIYDMHNRNLSSFECLKTYYDSEAKEYKAEDLYKYYEKDKNNYLITFKEIKDKDEEFKKLNKKLYIKGARNGYTYFVYLILPQKK